MSKRWIIYLVLGGIVFGLLNGCGNRTQTTSILLSDVTNEEGDMYSETLAAAKELNNQSNLLGVTLLGLPPEDAMYPGPNQYGDGNDYYSIFSYGDKACITEVEVSSPEANIYGIAPGDEAASIETILISQGYSLVSDDLSGEKDTIFYQKYHISIQLTVPRDSSDLDTAVITRIAIVVRDPDDVGAVF